MTNPWFKFFPTDWRADPALIGCSLAARGLWIEMIGLMHQSSEVGYLLVNGQPPTDRQLARLVHADGVDEVVALLSELELAGVFSRRRDGTIYSRRMVKNEKKSKILQKNGKLGGNPSLSKQTGKSALVNQISNQEVNPPVNTQKPEARSQKPESRIQRDNNTTISEAARERACGDVDQTHQAKPDQATALIRILDDEIIRAFGPAQARPWPNPSDLITARRMIEAGADPEMVRSVIAAICASKASRGQRPPGALRYFDRPIADAIATANQPPTEGVPSHDNRSDNRRRNPYDDANEAIERAFGLPAGSVVGLGAGPAAASRDQPGPCLEGDWSVVGSHAPGRA